jgi:hypothetical protein
MHGNKLKPVQCPIASNIVTLRCQIGPCGLLRRSYVLDSLVQAMLILPTPRPCFTHRTIAPQHPATSIHPPAAHAMCSWLCRLHCCCMQVLGARDLSPKARAGLPDPYCKILCGQAQHRTATQRRCASSNCSTQQHVGSKSSSCRCTVLAGTPATDSSSACRNSLAL